MLAVPEVIVITTAAAREEPSQTEAAPSKPPRDTDAKLESSPRAHSNFQVAPAVPTRKTASPSGRRSDDTFLVKPE